MGCFIFFALFYLIGFGLLGFSVWSALRSTRAANWPLAPATISHLRLEEHADSDGSTYEVQVRYSYQVEGVAYSGSRVSFGYSPTSDREEHDAIHRRLKEASSVSVRYNPANPAVSCLSYGLHRGILTPLAFALIWLALTAGFTILFFLNWGTDSVLLDNMSVK